MPEWRTKMTEKETWSIPLGNLLEKYWELKTTRKYFKPDLHESPSLSYLEADQKLGEFVVQLNSLSVSYTNYRGKADN